MITFLYNGSNKTLLILMSCSIFLNVVTRKCQITAVAHICGSCNILFGSADFESEEHSYLWRSHMSETLLKTDAISATTIVINTIKS